jgi:hypothetical protein
VQRSVALQDDEWQVPAAAVSGPQNLTGCSQSKAAVQAGSSNARQWPGRAKAEFKLAAVNQSSEAGQQGKF